jgi:hypothetical protein
MRGRQGLQARQFSLLGTACPTSWFAELTNEVS